jgi:small subunit ribosomal protein S4
VLREGSIAIDEDELSASADPTDSVNGKRVDRASYAVRTGITITLREAMRALPLIIESWARPALQIPEWMSRDTEAMSVAIVARPEGPAPFQVQTSLVVEYYAPRL